MEILAEVPGWGLKISIIHIRIIFVVDSNLEHKNNKKDDHAFFLSLVLVLTAIKPHGRQRLWS
jgi:hypothetical protein